MSLFGEASELKRAIEPYIKKVIDEHTRECLRTYKAKVITAPNATTGKCEIQLIGETSTLLIPFSTAVSNVSVGDMVWVATTYNSWRNAVVWQKIDFS